MNTNNKSLIKLLNNEENFITRNSSFIMILVILLITLGLSRINVPIYENVKIFIKTHNNNQVYLIKTTNKLSLKKEDTISVLTEKGSTISLKVLQNKRNEESSFLLKTRNITLIDTTSHAKEDIIYGKIILGKENLILSLYNNILNKK